MKASFLLLMGGVLTCLDAAAEAPSWPAVREAVAGFVERREIAGAVTLVASREEILHLDAVGKADLSSGRAMSPDALMWVASMTKPITACAVMVLRDEGKLALDDPVSKHLPEFARLEKEITLWHLLTHTSGLSEKPREAKPATLAEMVALYPTQPLQFEPGSRWAYCNPGINTLGRVVEVVSGQSFDSFLHDRFFEPLGMRDTGFRLTAEQEERLATAYRRTEGGELEASGIFFLPGGARVPPPDVIPLPAGGLFSTAGDMAAFYRMVLNGGSLDGRDILSPETVREMTRVHTGDLKAGFTDGMGWGLGFGVVREPSGVTAMLSPGTFGHGGAYGTQVWCDPKRDRLYLLMVQRANFPNSDASELRRVFQDTAAAASPSREGASR